MTPSLKLRQSRSPGGAAGDLNAAAADVDDHRDVARDVDAVDRGKVDEPGLFRARDHRGRMPVCCVTAWRNSPPFFASRVALVATAMT